MSDLVSRKAVLKYINDHKEFTAYKEHGKPRKETIWMNYEVYQQYTLF